MLKQLVCTSMLSMFGATLSAPSSTAQDGDRYRYCQQQAERVSGYRGEVPEDELEGGFLRGAIGGAATGAAIGIIGGDDIDTGEAAGRAALLGGLIGAIRRGHAEDEQRRARERYALELDACMRG